MKTLRYGAFTTTLSHGLNILQTGSTGRPPTPENILVDVDTFLPLLRLIKEEWSVVGQAVACGGSAREPANANNMTSL